MAKKKIDPKAWGKKYLKSGGLPDRFSTSGCGFSRKGPLVCECCGEEVPKVTGHFSKNNKWVYLCTHCNLEKYYDRCEHKFKFIESCEISNIEAFKGKKLDKFQCEFCGKLYFVDKKTNTRMYLNHAIGEEIE